MASRKENELQISFETGVLESQESSMVPLGFAAKLENWIPESTGGLRCRRGWINTSTTSAPATRRARGIGFFSLDNQSGDVKTKSGSFVANTATGNQAVTGVGFTPKAIIFSTVGATATGFVNTFRAGVGFTTGASASYSVSAHSENGAATADANRRMAAKALTIITAAAATDGECDLVSFDSDGFTVNWTDAPAGAYIVNYMAIGGADVSGAKAVHWQTNAATGNQSVTGVGFQPSLVIHAASGTDNALPSTVVNAHLGFGAMDSSGNQWANAFGVDDNVADSNSARSQKTDRCLLNVATSGASNVLEASYVSMDSDGFTVNINTAWGVPRNCMSLCLKLSSNGRAKVGSFAKDTGAAPDAQSVTGVGFTPTGVMLASWNNAASTTPTTHAQWSLGAASGATSEKGMAIRDEDAQATSDAQGYQNDLVASHLDPSTASTLDAQGNFTSFDSDGFSLSWSTNDGDADQVLYLAIGGATSSGVDKVLVAQNDSSTNFDIYALSTTQLDAGTWSAIDSNITVTDALPLVPFTSGLGYTHYTHKKFATARRWDGTTAAAIAGSPAGRAIAFHKNRVFIGGTEANPTRLWYSDLGDSGTWPATSYIEVGEDDGEAIEDIAYFEDGVIIAKRNSLWYLSGSGPDTFTLHQLNAGGGYYGRCIVATPYGAVIAGRRQVWLWTGGGVELISRPIEETYELAGDFVTTAYEDGVCYICDEGSGTKFCIDLQRGAWWMEKTDSASTEGPACIASKNGYLYYGPQNATTISLLAYRETPGSPRARDAGLTETFKVWTPEYWLTSPAREFTPKHLFVKFRQRAGASGTAITVTPIFDGTAEATQTIDAQAAAGTYRVNLPMGSKRGIHSVQFKFEVTYTTSDTNLTELEEITFIFDEENVRAAS